MQNYLLTYILNHNSNLAMKNMTIDTANPANIIKIQTFADNGDIKENKSTAFSGALTYNTLIPVNKIILQNIQVMKSSKRGPPIPQK